MDDVRGLKGPARWAMRLYAVAACVALLIATEVWAAGTKQPTDPAKQQDAEAAKKAETQSRHDAADRLIALRRMISAEERSTAIATLGDRTDELLLALVDGTSPTSEFNSQIKKIDGDLLSIRRKAVPDSVQGTAPWDASLREIHFGIGVAVLLSLGSLSLSLFLHLRRRHVVEQTLRDAGLL